MALLPSCRLLACGSLSVQCAAPLFPLLLLELGFVVCSNMNRGKFEPEKNSDKENFDMKPVVKSVGFLLNMFCLKPSNGSDTSCNELLFAVNVWLSGKLQC